MKSLILFAVILTLTAGCDAQLKNPVTASVKVYGNCSICEAAIEKAGTVKGTAQTDWNKDTKIASIRYDARRTSKEAVLKLIALAGYDNETYLAPDEAYARLQSCCQYTRAKKVPATTVTTVAQDNPAKPVDHSGHEGPVKQPVKQADEAPVKQPVKQADQLQAVLGKYFALKDALVKSDAKLVTDNALTMLTAVNAVKMESLGTDEHVVWMKVNSELARITGLISKAKDLAAQRDYFASLSAKMYELAKAAKPAGPVYYQHCPMYNDGKGANWLSRESSIKNPYYGSMMLNCGKTVETIGQ